MIKDVVLNSNDTDSAVLSLVNSVYDVGAKDNVTAILAKIED
jgi:serine/threonine protein phosphatase PrpC